MKRMKTKGFVGNFGMTKHIWGLKGSLEPLLSPFRASRGQTLGSLVEYNFWGLGQKRRRKGSCCEAMLPTRNTI